MSIILGHFFPKETNFFPLPKQDKNDVKSIGFLPQISFKQKTPKRSKFFKLICFLFQLQSPPIEEKEWKLQSLKFTTNEYVLKHKIYG